MDYSQLSDRDIDALVLQRVYGNQAKDKDIMRAWLRGGFKFTTNAADAWPIIAKHRISIEFDGDHSTEPQTTWCHTRNLDRTCGTDYQKNPLRAAMITFLLMQERENA